MPRGDGVPFGQGVPRSLVDVEDPCHELPPHSSIRPQGTICSVRAEAGAGAEQLLRLASFGRPREGDTPWITALRIPAIARMSGLRRNFGVIGLGTCTGLAILFAIIF